MTLSKYQVNTCLIKFGNELFTQSVIGSYVLYVGWITNVGKFGFPEFAGI